MVIPSYFVLSNNIVFFIVRLVIAIIVGLLAVKLRAIVYTLIASLIGATLMKQAVLMLFPALSTSWLSFLNIIVLVLVVLGILSQLEEYGRISE